MAEKMTSKDFSFKSGRLSLAVTAVLIFSVIIFLAAYVRTAEAQVIEDIQLADIAVDEPLIRDNRRAVNGELVFRAFKESFPDRISAVEFIDDDWAITVRGQTFFWAEGRLLPEAERHKIDVYSPHSFHAVPASPPSPDSFSPEHIEMLRYRGSREARSVPVRRHNAFHGALYGGLERRQVEAQLERIVFLGFRVTVNRNIVEALRRIDAEISNWEGGEAFIASIRRIDGYNWREIAGTQRMSFHSWGLALDIVPRSLGGRAIFWLWERNQNENWMLIPLENRWSPPDQVIEAFEREGFIWGGKWAFFDNMHFEYRPELHALTRLMER